MYGPKALTLKQDLDWMLDRRFIQSQLAIVILSGLAASCMLCGCAMRYYTGHSISNGKCMCRFASRTCLWQLKQCYTIIECTPDLDSRG